jgi:hypothetical protein
MAAGEKKPRIKGRVRAMRVDTKCGAIGHMTVDEIRERMIGDDLSVTCPECGEIHLTAEDAEAAAARKVRDTPRYKRIVQEASAVEPAPSQPQGV